MPAPTPSRPSRYRICVVCMGNICRSPMGEAVLRARLDDAGLSHAVTVDSAGTGGWHVGDDADPRARRTLARHGYPLDHTARQFDAAWFDERDLVVAMDVDNLRRLLRLAPDDEARDRVRMMRSFDPRLAHLTPGHPELDVPDPYYGGDSGFDDVLAMLEAAADGVVAHVRSVLGDPVP